MENVKACGAAQCDCMATDTRGLLPEHEGKRLRMYFIVDWQFSA
jgi:hypothetical protein